MIAILDGCLHTLSGINPDWYSSYANYSSKVDPGTNLVSKAGGEIWVVSESSGAHFTKFTFHGFPETSGISLAPLRVRLYVNPCIATW